MPNDELMLDDLAGLQPKHYIFRASDGLLHFCPTCAAVTAVWIATLRGPNAIVAACSKCQRLHLKGDW